MSKKKLDVADIISGLGLISEQFKGVIPDNEEERKSLDWGIDVVEQARQKLHDFSGIEIQDITNCLTQDNSVKYSPS